MKLPNRIALLGTLIISVGCAEEIPIGDMDRIPPVTPADARRANVYKGLDGTWRGRFKIYERVKQAHGKGVLAEPRPVVKGDWSPRPWLKSGALKLKMRIDVEQVYTSETPYFQRVRIRDTYTDAKGKKRVVHSRGVNKIQDGVMWCVVRKPHETVIHRGSTEGKDVIIWQRDVKAPLRIEYFHETVRENAYTIRGWGYYGKDDPDQAPRLWFLGEYKRVR